MDESKKWKAHAGILFCKELRYNPYQGNIILPGNKAAETVFQVLDIGPGVDGYEVGDLVVTRHAVKTVMGSFIREVDVLGKLDKSARAGATVSDPGFVPESPARTAEERDLVNGG